MELNELGAILKEMYFNSPDKETVAMIHLFGIKYAKEISDLDASFKDIAIAGGINKSYGTEISKGAKLAKYVTVNHQEDRKMETFRIAEVRVVSGNTLYATWRTDMQIVSTDKGEFIDNAPGLGPFDSKWKKLGASPGFDWKSKVGEEVTGVIRESRRHKWLNKY